MSHTCLFIINGLGLGNSTRCYAVMEHLVEQGPHLSDGSAKDDQVGIGDGTAQVARGHIHGAKLLAFGDAGSAAHEADDGVGQAALFEGQTKGASQQADADESDFLPTHGR